MCEKQIKHLTHHVKPEVGLRLDRALANALPQVSRSRIKKIIMNSFVRKGVSPITDASYMVKQGDEFEVDFPTPIHSSLQGEKIPLDVKFEDDAVIVINKPANLTVHPGSGRQDGTLVNALIAHCNGSLSGIGGVYRPGIVHRLDKDTSGLMVIAKSDIAHKSLASQFEARTIDRSYHAIVWGNPLPIHGTIEANIGRSRHNRTKMAIVPKNQGKYALTQYETLNTFGQIASILECRLSTGRTHQIRIHLSHLGHSIIGDPVYGRVSAPKRSQLSTEFLNVLKSLNRQALHAVALGFEHPLTHRRLYFESSPPSDIKLLKDTLTTEYGGL